MNDEKFQDAEFLLRRTAESFSDAVIFLPVLMAFVVLGLIVLFRRENRFAGMLIPFVVVTVLSIAYVPLAFVLKPYFSWWVVLVPTLLVALFYVGLMYVKDAQTIHPLWAAFLGFLRCAVYTILAFVFLLPGCQYYEQQEYPSKVVFLFDVSKSMDTVDDLPEVGQDPSKLPTRQDKVIQTLAGKAAVFQKTLAKTAITAYRFGGVADEAEVLQFKGGDGWNAEQWAEWLKPDKKNIKAPEKLTPEERAKHLARMSDLYDSLLGSTNVAGSANQVAKAESANLLQAVVLFSDGQSNVGSDEARKEFLARVNNPKKPIQVYTVGVGDFRQPANIRIDDLQAPEIARPDDKFPVRVPVVGSGLPDEEFEVTLEATRVEDGFGKAVEGERTFVLGPKKGKFQGGGDHPNDTVEFEIDIQDLKKLKAADDKTGELEGTWKFVAKVPRHPREAFPKAEHVSDPPTRVLVQKKKLRVLLFAGGPGRDYQFIRTLLFREVTEKRLEMSVLLQTEREAQHVDQDVEADRLLTRFPDTIGPSKEKYMSLSDYDVILAIDPDWTALDVNQLKNLKDWVGTHAGGIVFVAGPVHTFSLARPGGLDLSSLLTIYPVVLKDSRLHNIGIGHDPTRPYTLGFSPAAKLYEFLKLDEAGESATAGWDEFFWGKGKANPGKDARPARGIYNYYPVERTKPASIVLATFEGPPTSRINDGKDPMPYIVAMPYGSGKTVYVGSAETWRLRTYKEAFHERFWIKLARYAAAGTVAQKKYGRILLGRQTTTGPIAFEAQLKGEDLQPLPRDFRPEVLVRRVEQIQDPMAKKITFGLKAKGTQGEWNGWFAGKVILNEPGEYEFSVPIPGTTETLTHRLNVKKPNLETDNLRTNFEALYQLATDADVVLRRLSEPAKSEVRKSLGRPPSEESPETSTKEKARLFFPLSAADNIPKCIQHVPPQKESVKGPFVYVWDKGVESGLEVKVLWLALLTPMAVGLLGGLILLVMRTYLGAVAFFGAGLVLGLVGLALYYTPTGIGEFLDSNVPVNFSFVLITVVSLLCVEWLTRKLLKLA